MGWAGRRADGVRAWHGCGTGVAWARKAAELLVDTVRDRRMRVLDGIHLRFLVISIIFNANLYYMHILLVIFVILHRKNEHLFGRVQFG